jgi:hypothetical protein
VSANPNTYRQFHVELVRDLVSMYRTMFPHEDVLDEAYEHVVRELDEKAAQDQALALLLSDGVDALHSHTEDEWSGLSREAKAEVLRGLEQTPFFTTLRAVFVTSFYSNPDIHSRFGYEGPSNDKGGYLHRGFNDIDWIDKAEG